MSILHVILAVLGIALLIIMTVARRAPHGYQDSHGFHPDKRH